MCSETHLPAGISVLDKLYSLCLDPTVPIPAVLTNLYSTLEYNCISITLSYRDIQNRLNFHVIKNKGPKQMSYPVSYKWIDWNLPNN